MSVAHYPENRLKRLSPSLVKLPTRVYFIGFILAYFLGAIAALFPPELRLLPSYASEILVVLSLPFAVLGLLRSNLQGKIVFSSLLLFAVVELASFIANPLPNFPQSHAAALGLFLEFKLFFVMFAVTHFAAKDPEGVAKSIDVVLVIVAVLAWINMPFLLRDLLDGQSNLYGERFQVRGDFILPTGIYHHKAISAQMALLAFIAMLSFWRRRLRREYKKLVLATMLVALIQVLAAISVKELISLLIVLIIYYSQRNGAIVGIRLFILTILAGLLSVGVLATDNRISVSVSDRFQRYTGEQSEQRIRNLFVSTSVDLANRNFPFGSGPGTFGSEPARTLGYSPIYVQYEFYRYIGGRPDGDAQYLVDAFWPKILGEGGWFGLIFYGSAILLLMIILMKMRRRFPDFRHFAFLQYTWLAVLPVSLASGILTNDRFALILALSGICFAQTKRVTPNAR
jgi:hypothetical protein